MRDWADPPPPTPASATLQAAIGGHPLVTQRLVGLGLADPAAAQRFLHPMRYQPTPATALPGLVAAVGRLRHALRRREPICVWGDFDVDGQTATTLLVSTLRALGGRITYHIPVRAAESHGVNLPTLREVLGAGVRLILTCDTGIAAHDAVAYAASQGVDTIITDHHDPPPALPLAYALINPKLIPSDGPSPHPLADLPGVGVAYKLAEELTRQAGRPELAESLLDLAALGIVADLARLTGDTRYLLQRGLAALRQTQRVGLTALYEAAELDAAGVTEEHIAFALGPRLNALGRLADANVAVELLTTTDLAHARILAADLEALNARRKLLCDQVEAAAEAQLARDRGLLDDAALVLAGPAWPAGVIGIVAARLVERYDKPAILFAAPPGEPARGSARSVEGVNVTAAIAAHADLLLSYGGHPMAAGLSLPAERIPEFRRAFNRTVTRMQASAPARPALALDGYISLNEITLALADDLERLAPWGPGNPPPVLGCRGVRVVAHRKVGRNDEHRAVTVGDDAGAAQRVIWWDGGGQPLPEGRFDLAFTVRGHDFGGARTAQITWLAARSAPRPPITARPAPSFEIVDLRGAADPRAALAGLPPVEDRLIWREASDLPGQDRANLRPAAELVIWTAPPGPAELRVALALAAPQRVYLFALDPGLDQPGVFLARLGGLVKHALRWPNEPVAIVRLAALTAQREAAVRLGLEWLAACGHITLSESSGAEALLAPGAGRPLADSGAISARLEALLAETAAYRLYFRHATPPPLHAAA